MERQYRQGSGRNEQDGSRERMRGLGGEWYGRDARGESRHQHGSGDRDREYSVGGEFLDEDREGYGEYEGGREQSFGDQDHRHGRGENEFSRSQRYRSGEYGEMSGDTRSGAYRNYGSLRNSVRPGSFGHSDYRSGAGGDYESTQHSQPYRYGSHYGDSSGREQGFRGRGPKNYTRSDDRIREDLNEQLMDADDIDASDVSIEVKDAVVTLSGNVEQRWTKHRIEDMAGDCIGVKDVRNEIRVQSRNDWPYDKQQATGGLGSTASSQGSSTTSGGVSSASRTQSGSSPH